MKSACSLFVLGELAPKGGLTTDLSWFVDDSTLGNAVELEGIAISQLSISTGEGGVLQQTLSFTYAQIAWTAGESQTTWDLLKGTP